MRFYFDIDDNLFTDVYGVDFKEAVKECAVESVAEKLYNDTTNMNDLFSEVRKEVNKIIVANSGKICDTVIERVTEHILKMKMIKENVPKASEFAALNKENVAYFEEMIDKAIAKKFRGK